jgi:Ca2+-binding EF-hand superfamily protein
MTSKLLFLKRAGLFAAACLFTLTCVAGDDTSRDEEIAQHFAAADTNHDGRLTLAEAEAGMPRVAANFSKIDADKSGTVTVAEIEAIADR